MSWNRRLRVDDERFTFIQAGGMVASLCLVGLLVGSVLSGGAVAVQGLLGGPRAPVQPKFSAASSAPVQVTAGPVEPPWSSEPQATLATAKPAATAHPSGSFVIPGAVAATPTVSQSGSATSSSTPLSGLSTSSPAGSLAGGVAAMPLRVRQGAESLLSSTVPAPPSSAAAAAPAAPASAPAAPASTPAAPASAPANAASAPAAPAGAPSDAASAPGGSSSPSDAASAAAQTDSSGSGPVTFSTQPAGITPANFKGIAVGKGGYDLTQQSDPSFAAVVVTETNAVIMQDLTAGTNGFGVAGYVFPSDAPFGPGNPLFTGQTYGPTWFPGSGTPEPPPSQWAIDPITGLPHDPATGGSVTPNEWAISSWNPHSPNYNAALYTAAGQTPPA